MYIIHTYLFKSKPELGPSFVQWRSVGFLRKNPRPHYSVRAPFLFSLCGGSKVVYVTQVVYV
jgi:hypothetical protein